MDLFVKLAKNADPDKYVYIVYGNESVSVQSFHYLTENVIIFGVDMTSSRHIDNKKKHISILGRNPVQKLDDTTLIVEAQYLIKFSRSNRKFYLNLNYNENISFLFVNATKIYFFTTKYSEIRNRKYFLLMCLGNISENFSANNMKKKKNRIKWMYVRF